MSFQGFVPTPDIKFYILPTICSNILTTAHEIL